MRPTEPGWYWYFSSGEPIVVRIERYRTPELFVLEAGDEQSDSVSVYAGQFVGPLVPPERPKV